MSIEERYLQNQNGSPNVFQRMLSYHYQECRHPTNKTRLVYILAVDWCMHHRSKQVYCFFFFLQQVLNLFSALRWQAISLFIFFIHISSILLAASVQVGYVRWNDLQATMRRWIDRLITPFRRDFCLKKTSVYLPHLRHA